MNANYIYLDFILIWADIADLMAKAEVGED